MTTVAHPDPLKGWSYVLAIAEDQINRGLAKAYAGANMGRLVPPLPKDRLSLPLDGGSGLKLEATLGCPTLQALETGLNRCRLTLPLLQAQLVDRDGPVGLGDGASLCIVTSLASIKSHLDEGGKDPAGGTVQHVAYVDVLSPEAAYAVVLGAKQPPDLLASMAEALKVALQKYAQQTYRIGSFGFPAQANAFVPETMAFTFVKDAQGPGRHAIVFCGQIAPTAAEAAHRVQYDNRLHFGPEILPATVPAAIWVGSSVVMDRLLLPMLASSLASGGNKPALVWTGQAVELASALEMAQVQGKRTVMQSFRVWPDRGRMAMQTVVRVYQIYGISDAVATIDGHLNFDLNSDHTSFQASSQVDGNRIDTINNNPTWWRWLAYIFTLGIARGIEAGVEHAIRNRMSGASYQQMDLQLKAAATKISEVAGRVPALEDLAAGGHLVFESVRFAPGGAAYLGVMATGVTQRR